MYPAKARSAQTPRGLQACIGDFFFLVKALMCNLCASRALKIHKLIPSVKQKNKKANKQINKTPTMAWLVSKGSAPARRRPQKCHTALRWFVCVARE